VYWVQEDVKSSGMTTDQRCCWCNGKRKWRGNL